MQVLIEVRGHVEFGIRSIHLAARKNIRTAEYVRLAMAPHQKHLQAVRGVAQHHDGGGGTRRGVDDFPV
jgi:hypothetical protein